MSDPVNNALAKKAELEQSVAELQQKLQRAAVELEEANTFLTLASKFSDSTPALAPLPPRLPMPSDLQAKKLSIPDAVASMLAGGEPIPTSELLVRLESRGLAIGGGERNKQLTNLSSTLSRDKARFDNVRGQGWKLRDTQKVESPSPVSAGDGLGDL